MSPYTIQHSHIVQYHTFILWSQFALDHCKQSSLASVHFSLQNALRHALLCTEPTAQPVLLAFSEPEEASGLFNPVKEVVRVGGMHLEQDALITHPYDYEGEPIAIYNN